MIKYWVDYIASEGTCTVEYRVTDILDWKQSKHEDLEENNIDFEYVCSHICLYTEPNMVARTLINKLQENS